MLFGLIKNEREEIEQKRKEREEIEQKRKEREGESYVGPYSPWGKHNYEYANDSLNEFSSYLQSEDYLSGRRARYKTGLVLSHLKEIAHEVPVEQRNFIIFPENPGSMDPVSLDEYGNNTKPKLPESSYCTIS